MKFLKQLITAGVIVGIMMSFSTIAFATENPTMYADNVTDESEDPLLDGATILLDETTIDGDRMITVKKYETRDGMIVVDTFERSAIAPLSKNRSDTATRKRELGRYGTVTLTASFRWYTDEDEGLIGVSYVKCTGMSASWTEPSGYTCDIWETDYDDEYLSFGKAEAKVTYKIYETRAPMYEQYECLKIICDDTGAISDKVKKL